MQLDENDEDQRDVLDDFVSFQGADLLMTLGRSLFSRHQDVASLSKVPTCAMSEQHLNITLSSSCCNARADLGGVSHRLR